MSEHDSVRIRDAQADGRPMLQIRVGPAVLVLDDLADLLTEVEQRTGETAQRRLVELDAEMARLAALRTEMVAMVEALPSAECPPPGHATTWCPPEERR